MMTWRLVGLCLALSAAQPAVAATLRVNFSGTIGDEQPNDPSVVGLSVGDRFSGYFTFDDSIAPTEDVPEQAPDPGNGIGGYPAWTLTEFSSPPWLFHFEVGDFSVSSDVSSEYFPTGGYSIQVSDSELDSAVDPSTVGVLAGLGELPPAPGTGFIVSYVQFALYGSAPGLPLHSTALSAVPWSLVDFPENELAIHFVHDSGTNEFSLFGTIDQLNVPEPASAAFAAVAALALTGLGIARARS